MRGVEATIQKRWLATNTPQPAPPPKSKKVKYEQIEARQGSRLAPQPPKPKPGAQCGVLVSPTLLGARQAACKDDPQLSLLQPEDLKGSSLRFKGVGGFVGLSESTL